MITQTTMKIPVKKTILDLAVGEVGFTMPWAMSVDGDGQGWLKTSYPAHEQPGGTVQMAVIRTATDYVVVMGNYGRPYKWDVDRYISTDSSPVAHFFDYQHMPVLEALRLLLAQRKVAAQTQYLSA